MSILPPKVIVAVANNVTPITLIPDPTFVWQPCYYQWQVDLMVSTPQTHSSPSTPTPYQYNAQDIAVGDWFCNGTDASALEIVSIVSSTSAYNATVIMEDIEYFNIFNDPTQTGFGGPSENTGVIFNLDNDGNPLMMGMPSNTLPDTYATDLISRFNYRNLQQKFIRVYQPGHTFVIGDIIQPNVSIVGTYMLATDTSKDLTVGIVSDVGTPSSDWFNFEASGEVVYNVSPPLVGSYGSLFYLDPANPGKLTSTRPADFARPIYLRLSSATTAIKFNQESVASETKNFKVLSLTEGQTTFDLPSDAFEVVSMSVNGVEVDFTFTTVGSLVVATFNPADNGYGIDTTDEVKFIYTT